MRWKNVDEFLFFVFIYRQFGLIVLEFVFVDMLKPGSMTNKWKNSYFAHFTWESQVEMAIELLWIRAKFFHCTEHKRTPSDVGGGTNKPNKNANTKTKPKIPTKTAARAQKNEMKWIGMKCICAQWIIYTCTRTNEIEASDTELAVMMKL